jgi:DNA-binding CsgD family transcriptional regulator
MAGRAAAPLVLPRKLRKAVRRLSRSAKAERRLVERAKIIELACQGFSNAEIARQVGCTQETVRKWRGRMAKEKKLAALNDRRRSGRPGSHVSRAVRHEFEYRRHGTSTLIAAFNIRTGEVFGQCRRRTAKGLVSFMEAVAKRYPTGPIYVIWDNLRSAPRTS